MFMFRSMIFSMIMVSHSLFGFFLCHLLCRSIENNMILHPVYNRLPLATLVQCVETGTLAIESIRIVPDQIRRHVCRAHEVHPESLNAVINVPSHHLCPATPG